MMDRKVDFLVCGTQKGGTSALDAYLRKHPELCMAKQKEVHYFDDEEKFADDRNNYDDYHSLFKLKNTHRMIGESTPIYMYWYSCPQRIWQYNPNMKIIISLRNPINRAFSHWNMERSRKLENLSFWDAIQNERERCRSSLPFQHRVYSYIDRGYYMEQLRRLWMYFPTENVWIINNEQLRENARDTLYGIFSFLGVSTDTEPKPKIVHAGRYKTRITKKERDFLRNVYQYEILELQQELGWDCNHWLE